LPNIPKHHLKIRSDYNFSSRFKVGATISAFTKSYMMGNENQEHDSSGGLQGEIPGYAILNMDSEYNFNKGWKLYIKAINVLDQAYFTGGRLAETQVDSNPRSHSGDDAEGAASLLPGSPQAAWIGLRHEF
jgi:outer membrane receptor for ferrienterochelin and colicin